MNYFSRRLITLLVFSELLYGACMYVDVWNYKEADIPEYSQPLLLNIYIRIVALASNLLEVSGYSVI